MPLFGTFDLAAAPRALPAMRDLDAEAWALPGAEILQLAWEVPRDVLTLLPAAMHPAIPTYATILVGRYPESPVGPFLLAQLRLMGRAGAHPRGFVLGAVATTDDAVWALREGWGFPARSGSVALRRRHDRVTATVVRDGVTILEVAMVDPEPISGGDVQYMHSVTLASVSHDGRTGPRLVQVDPHYTFHRAERGKPRVSRIVPEAWGAPSLRLVHPIASTVTTCDTDLPRIRFIIDPEVPVVRGTVRIRS